MTEQEKGVYIHELQKAMRLLLEGGRDLEEMVALLQKWEEMGLDSEGYCGIRMYGDWKLEMVADTLCEQLLGDKHQIIQTALDLLKKYYRESSRKDQQGNSERKIQLEVERSRLEEEQPNRWSAGRLWTWTGFSRRWKNWST